jgi:hypothetical protein
LFAPLKNCLGDALENTAVSGCMGNRSLLSTQRVLTECPLRVKLRNTQHEQMSSALHPTTDVGLARAKGVTRIDGVGAYKHVAAIVMERRCSPCAKNRSSLDTNLPRAANLPTPLLEKRLN